MGVTNRLREQTASQVNTTATHPVIKTYYDLIWENPVFAFTTEVKFNLEFNW